MEKNIKEIDSCKREMEIKLSMEEVQPYFDKAYKDAQKWVNIKGFRKGKVPVKVIKQYYGPKIEGEALEGTFSKIFNDIITEEKIAVVGQPKISDMNKDGEEIKFIIEFEVLPTFELQDYKGLQINEPIHSVSDDEIKEEVDKVALNNGKLDPAEEVTDDMHVVEILLHEIDEQTGVPIVGPEPQTTHIFLADSKVMPELKASLLNTKTGDTFNFKPKEADEHAPDKNFSVEVKAIQKLTPIDLNDEFIKTYSKDKFDTVDEFKEELGFQLQEGWNQKGRQEMENQIINTIVDLHPDLQVPDQVVNQVQHAMAEDIKKRYKDIPQGEGLDIEKMVGDLKPLAERTVKWEILRGKIMEAEDIKVEDHDIEQMVEFEANRTKSDKEAVKRQILQNKNVTDNIVNKRVMDLIVDFAITSEVTFDGEPIEDEE